MSELIERLKSFLVDDPDYGKCLRMSIKHEDVAEAAALITAQAAEIERLRAALERAKPYVELQNIAEGIWDGFGPRSPRRSDDDLLAVIAALTPTTEKADG